MVAVAMAAVKAMGLMVVAVATRVAVGVRLAVKPLT